MEENKVVLSLEKYLEMYDKNKQNEELINILFSLLINNTELTSNKKKLEISSYGVKYGKIIDLLYKYKPEEMKERYEYLMKDEED